MSGDSSVAGRMIPELAEHNRDFWTGGRDGRLHVPFCTACDRWVLPPGAECPSCGGELVSRAVSGEGTVFTYTVNHHAFNPEVAPPYVVAIVALSEQDDLRLAANVVDCEPDSVTSGMPVSVRFEPQPGDVYVPVFAPR